MPRPHVQRRSVVRKSRNSEPLRFALGLDLGQVRDHSGIVVVERIAQKWDDDLEACIQLQAPEYRVRHVERLALGTTYPDVVDRVEELLNDPLLADRTRLVIDGTGVGVPVMNMFQQRGRSLLPVMITGGDSTTYAGRIVRVPKRNLVSVLQVLFQSHRLKIAAGVDERDTLLRELANFSAKITIAAHDTFEAWREGQHDDLVLALALACWSFERSSGSGQVNLRVNAFSGSGAIFRS
jgi:hypothetical protein